MSSKDVFHIQYDDSSIAMPQSGSGFQGTEDRTRSSSIGTNFSVRQKRSTAILCFLALTIIISRLLVLQIANGKTFAAIAEDNRTTTRIYPAERGVIYDRNNVVIAQNEPVFNIIADGFIADLPSNELSTLILKLSALYTDINIQDIYNRIQNAEVNREFILAEDIPKEQAIALQSTPAHIEGLRVEQGNRRSYITDSVPSLSHVIGYTAGLNADEYNQLKDDGYRVFDRIGKSGIERFYEKELRGQNGAEVFEVNAQGIPQRIESEILPVDGQDMHLAIDVALQSHIESILKRRLDSTEANRASVVVMDPKTGAIFALVSWPAYDANAFSRGISSTDYTNLITNEDNPLFNRTVSGELPAGSTVKTLYAAAALEEGVITPSTTFISTGGLQVGPRFFPDWRAGGHGTTNVYHAIADSVNTFFYIIGGGYDNFAGMGVQKLMEHARKYGLGSVTGIDLPSEADGFLPSPEWKEEVKGERWFVGDTYNVSIGQGDVLVTPLQIARMTSVFANGGKMITPHVDMNRSVEAEQVVSAEIADIVRRGMRQTVTAGSATSLQAVASTVAGKTGTAQWSSTKTPHSWFTGFAPYDNPQVLVTVIVEEGSIQSPATPIAKDVFDWWFDESNDQGTLEASPAN